MKGRGEGWLLSPGYIEVEGGVLFHQRRGSGETIVFIHGNYNDHRIWEEQMERFSTSYDVIGYDLRGYGHSDTPRASFSHVEDLKLLLDTLGLTKVTLVGSSLGGSVATDFTLVYPGYVDRLILAAPSVSGRSYPARMLWQGIKQHIQVRLKGAEQAIDHFIANSYWDYYFPAATKEKARQKTIDNVRNPGNFCRFPPSLSRVPKPYAIHRLAEIAQPVLILIGALDHPYNRETAEILHKGIRRSTKIIFPDGRHLPFIEEPEKFSALTVEFLRDNHNA
ncbi:alpha/beta fold hydrolase [Paenibacillus sp. FSL H7-0756]|uniref:alpha/beta fold hydrolase n=1 Tax=Paenibacillus sp. FSL H7-0756 TaxID=2954738 RepID=UPI0030F768F2